MFQISSAMVLKYVKNFFRANFTSWSKIWISEIDQKISKVFRYSSAFMLNYVQRSFRKISFRNCSDDFRSAQMFQICSAMLLIYVQKCFSWKKYRKQFFKAVSDRFQHFSANFKEKNLHEGKHHGMESCTRERLNLKVVCLFCNLKWMS